MVKNVGSIDSAIRIILGIAGLAAVVYNYVAEPIMPTISVIGTAVLSLVFLITGYKKMCPIFKGLGISSAKK